MTIITNKINYVIERGDNLILFDVNHQTYCNIILIIYICDVLTSSATNLYVNI